MPKSKKKTVQVGTYLPAETFAELKRLSERTRVPMTVYVKEAIERLLKQYRQ